MSKIQPLTLILCEIDETAGQSFQTPTYHRQLWFLGFTGHLVAEDHSKSSLTLILLLIGHVYSKNHCLKIHFQSINITYVYGSN